MTPCRQGQGLTCSCFFEVTSATKLTGGRTQASLGKLSAPAPASSLHETVNVARGTPASFPRPLRCLPGAINTAGTCSDIAFPGSHQITLICPLNVPSPVALALPPPGKMAALPRAPRRGRARGGPSQCPRPGGRLLLSREGAGYKRGGAGPGAIWPAVRGGGRVGRCAARWLSPGRGCRTGSQHG